MATNKPSSGQAGYNLPNYEDPLGIAANFATQTYSSNGTPKETNPPKPPAKAPNSSPTTQMDGSSLPKTVQGVFKGTITDLNNAIPAHGCSIKLPALMAKIKQETKLFPQINTKRLVEFATWLGVQISPIVEGIKNFIRAIQAKIKIIMKFVKWIQKQIKIITEWVALFSEFMAFLLTVPEKLLKLVANCLNAVQNFATNVIKDTLKSLSDIQTSTTGDNGTTANISGDFVDELGDIPGPDQVTVT